MAPVIKQEPVDEPMSRTEEYRKIVKPLIERKRRARINNCLDELKDLMMFALQSEGESISKLEKADVLELTVKHLRRLRRHQMLTPSPPHQDRYQAGYTACATEVSRCLASVPSEAGLRTRLMSHLGLAQDQPPLRVHVPVPSYPASLLPSANQRPVSRSRDPSQPIRGQYPDSDPGYISGRDSPLTATPPESPEIVWRPF